LFNLKILYFPGSLFPVFIRLLSLKYYKKENRKMYKVREYNENSESSFIVDEFENFENAKNKADEIGKNGEVWNETDEECIYFNR
jgi:hypothetical protein